MKIYLLQQHILSRRGNPSRWGWNESGKIDSFFFREASIHTCIFPFLHVKSSATQLNDGRCVGGSASEIFAVDLQVGNWGNWINCLNKCVWWWWQVPLTPLLPKDTFIYSWKLLFVSREFFCLHKFPYSGNVTFIKVFFFIEDYKTEKYLNDISPKNRGLHF